MTIACYLFGFGVGQIIYGPVSDRFGRRPVLLIAIALYGVATIACALAPSIDALIAARFVQALGGAGSVVLARAVVRDIYSGVRAGRELSIMGSITALAPIVAPTIGGLLQTMFGWRACFILLISFAAIAGAAAALLLPETLHKRTPGPFSLVTMATLYKSVLVHRGFLANLGIMTTAFIGLFAWISGAPIVMQGAVYGLSPLAFGVIFGMGAAGYMAGTFIASRIVMRFGLDRMMGVGTVIMVGGGLVMILVVGFLANAVWFVGGDDDLSRGPRLRAAVCHGGRVDAVSRSCRHRVVGDGLRPAARRGARGGPHRPLSRPFRLAGHARRRGDGLRRLFDLGPHAQSSRGGSRCLIMQRDFRDRSAAPGRAPMPAARVGVADPAE